MILESLLSPLNLTLFFWLLTSRSLLVGLTFRDLANESLSSSGWMELCCSMTFYSDLRSPGSYWCSSRLMFSRLRLILPFMRSVLETLGSRSFWV